MIKINVLTGFLGAGKTTFIKLLMEKQIFRKEKVIIIENEFGEVSIDDKILENDSYTILEISGGCICCSLKGHFIKALNEIAQKEQPDRVIIEPSGIFIIEDIFTILKDPYLNKDYALDSIITVIDIMHYKISHMRFAPFFDSQMKYANHIIISKIKNHDDAEIDEIIDDIKTHNHSASIHAIPINNWQDENMLELFNESYKKIDSKSEKVDHEKSHQITSIGFKSVKEYTQAQLSKVLRKLTNGDYGEIIRIKGFLLIDNERVLIDYVNGKINYTISKEGPLTLTIIGMTLNKPKLRQIFSKES